MKKFISMLVAILLGLIATAHAEADFPVINQPSVIIGPLDWVPVTTLDPKSEEAKLAQNVGVLRANNKKCTGWIHPVSKEVYTAHHCLTPLKLATLTLQDGTVLELSKWLCNEAPGIDVCRTVDQGEGQTIEPAQEFTMKRTGECYLLHQQKSEILISPVCEYSTDPAFFLRFRHTADSFFGSSGGMLVDKETHLPLGVHTSGHKEKQVNFATRLNVL